MRVGGRLPSSTHGDVSLSPLRQMERLPGERWGECRVLGEGRSLNQRAQVGRLTPLLTHTSEPQLAWWHKSAMTGGLRARDDACHHLGRPGTKEGQQSRETEWGFSFPGSHPALSGNVSSKGQWARRQSPCFPGMLFFWLMETVAPSNLPFPLPSQPRISGSSLERQMFASRPSAVDLRLSKPCLYDD